MTDQAQIQHPQAHPPIGSPFGIIAGGGSLPFAVADSLQARGIKPVVFALKGFCDPALVARFQHHWIPIGQFGRLLKLMRSENCRDLTFIGTLGAAGNLRDQAGLGNASRDAESVSRVSRR
jgi:DUF1009 family protein